LEGILEEKGLPSIEKLTIAAVGEDYIKYLESFNGKMIGLKYATTMRILYLHLNKSKTTYGRININILSEKIQIDNHQYRFLDIGGAT